MTRAQTIQSHPRALNILVFAIWPRPSLNKRAVHERVYCKLALYAVPVMHSWLY